MTSSIRPHWRCLSFWLSSRRDGYKIVQVKAKDQVKTLPEYDEAIMKEFGGNTVSARPTVKRRAHHQ